MTEQEQQDCVFMHDPCDMTELTIVEDTDKFGILVAEKIKKATALNAVGESIYVVTDRVLYSLKMNFPNIKFWFRVETADVSVGIAFFRTDINKYGQFITHIARM